MKASDSARSAAARKAAMTRHHGAQHPATMAAAQQHATAKLAQQLQNKISGTKAK